MLNIIYDATIVTNIFYKNDNRSGIFVVGLNILKEIAKRDNINIILYFSPEYYPDGVRVKKEIFPFLDSVQDLSGFETLCKLYNKLRLWYEHNYNHIYIRKIFALGLKALGVFFKAKVNICKNKVEKTSVFFSPVFKIPKEIRNFPHIKAFIYLHDAIPFVRPDLNPCGKHFLAEIIKSAKEDDFFFFNSFCTQRDFKKTVPSLIRDNSAVVPLASEIRFEKKFSSEQILKIREKYHIPDRKRYVFSLCTLEPRKNLLRIVKSFLFFLEKNNIHDLVLVMGGYAWVSFIQTLKKESIVWNNDTIIRAGYIDDEDLPFLYGNAEWFIYTSQYEGFGLSPLEAMQCGCPVITSNNSSLPEVVAEAGIMIDWDSDEQHVQAYEKLYYDDNLRRAYGRKGLERSKKFSWAKTVDLILEGMRSQSEKQSL